MRKKSRPYFTIDKITGILLLIVSGCGMGCTKQPDGYTPDVQPPITVSPPTGEIQTFLLTDSLVAFNTGTTAKWLVTGTNLNSVITFNGVKVGNYGVLDTGPLKQTSTFTLAVNNGKKASLILKVADSVTTILWGKGRRLKQTKLEMFIVPAGKTDPVWVDTPMTARVADRRIYFNLDGSSNIIQSVSSRNVPPYPDAGPFVVNASQTAFTWQSIVFNIDTLNNNKLVVTYDAHQANGTTVRTRNTYLFE